MLKYVFISSTKKGDVYDLIMNFSRIESVWKVTMQSMSLSLCDVTTAPSMSLGMFDEKLWWVF